MTWDYQHHPHGEERKAQGPVMTSDHVPGALRFNRWLAMKITSGVGTMWCAYVFAAFDLLALPEALRSGAYGIVQWTTSFFLQLVLLSIIMVGQNMSSAASDKRAQQTYLDAEAVLHEAMQIQQHLLEQDRVITETLEHAKKLAATGK